ncbi:zf-TFIIB domain-containing protein [Aeromonas sp. HMWF015]|nr:hypothetical protein DBR13_12985 [Aeromonas sp. HMWF015]
MPRSLPALVGKGSLGIQIDKCRQCGGTWFPFVNNISN